jgi:muramidase (phage lysozyme)
MPRISASEAGGQNVCAFLDMLAVSEIGAALLAKSDDGYNVLVGGQLFVSYADHPNIYNQRFNSTAAGRYQLLHRWWPAYRSLLQLPDFSPLSQDKVALQQIHEQGAIPDIQAGRFDQAVMKVANIWASLPGNSYQQHQNAPSDLRAAYLAAGGTLA